MGLKKNTNQGFTLMEVMFVMIILAVLIPGITILFISNIRSYVKVLALQEVKRNGDSALNLITSNIRSSAQSIYSDLAGSVEVCSTKTSSSTPSSFAGQIYFKDLTGAIYYYSLGSNSIIYTKGVDTNPITNNKVIISDLDFSCERSGDSNQPIISINFTAENLNSDRPEEAVSLSYSSKVKLRSY